MKNIAKFIFLILLFSFSIFFNSCATAITTAKNVKPYELTNTLETACSMDFIGYKIDSNILSTSASAKTSAGIWGYDIDTVMSEFDQAKAIANTESLKKLGYILENHGIALDKSSNYFGIYSLQEMELYKGENRYVTFIEIAQSKLNYDDNKGSKNIWGGFAGGFIAAGVPIAGLGYAWKDDEYAGDLGNTYMKLGIGASAIGLLCAIPVLLPTKTKIDFTGLYNIYLYDTMTKQLIRKDAVSVNVKEEFTGSYTYDDSSKAIVQDYISRHIYNEIMKKYSELNVWLKSR